MEKLTGVIEFAVARAIKGIADDGMADVIHMDANLMGPARQKTAAHQGDFALFESLFDMEEGDRFFAVQHPFLGYNTRNL